MDSGKYIKGAWPQIWVDTVVVVVAVVQGSAVALLMAVVQVQLRCELLQVADAW